MDNDDTIVPKSIRIEEPMIPSQVQVSIPLINLPLTKGAGNPNTRHQAKKRTAQNFHQGSNSSSNHHNSLLSAAASAQNSKVAYIGKVSKSSQPRKSHRAAATQMQRSTSRKTSVITAQQSTSLAAPHQQCQKLLAEKIDLTNIQSIQHGEGNISPQNEKNIDQFENSNEQKSKK